MNILQVIFCCPDEYEDLTNHIHWKKVSRGDGATARLEGEENFVGDSEIIALGGASNETKDRPLG